MLWRKEIKSVQFRQSPTNKGAARMSKCTRNRDKDGQFAKENTLTPNVEDIPKIEKVSNIGESNKNSLTNNGKSGTLSSGVTDCRTNQKIYPPKATGFRDDDAVDNHKKHVPEMGFKNFKEYEQAGINFFNESDGEYYYTEDGHYCKYKKYNDGTNEFASVYDDGVLATYFNPTRKSDYWDDQINEDE